LIGGIALGVLVALAIVIMLIYVLIVGIGLLLHGATRSDRAVALVALVVGLVGVFFGIKATAVGTSPSAPATPTSIHAPATSTPVRA
jgi:hypothetical protein